MKFDLDLAVVIDVSGPEVELLASYSN